MSDKTGWQIELIGKRTGNLTGMTFDRKTGRLVGVSDETVSYPTKEAAIAFADEWGLEVDVDVKITDHVWVEDDR